MWAKVPNEMSGKKLENTQLRVQHWYNLISSHLCFRLETLNCLLNGALIRLIYQHHLSPLSDFLWKIYIPYKIEPQFVKFHSSLWAMREICASRELHSMVHRIEANTRQTRKTQKNFLPCWDENDPYIACITTGNQNEFQHQSQPCAPKDYS